MSRRSPANPGGVDVHTDDLGRTHEHAPLRRHTGSEATHRMLTLVTAAGLGVDAYVHWHLAPGFDTLTGAASPHISQGPVSYTHLRAHETVLDLVCRLLLEKKK